MACSEVAAFLQTAGAHSGALRAKRGPGASTNMTDFRFVKSKIDGENATVWSEK